MTASPDVSTLTYEQALEELDGIISRLEHGDVDLDDAIRSYERGSILAQRCAELLDRTEAAVTKLVVGGGGNQQERPFVADGEAGAGEGHVPAPRPPARDASPAAVRPLAPPPPTSPARARPMREGGGRQGPGRDPGLFPGLEPAARPPAEPDFDLDDIPF